MNDVYLMGRLVDDVDLRYVGNDIPLGRITVATDKKMSYEKRKEAERKGESTADFIPATIWGSLAERANKHVGKGSRVAIKGKLVNNRWTDKSGNTRWTLELIVESMDFIDWKDEKKKTKEKTEEYVGYIPEEYKADVIKKPESRTYEPKKDEDITDEFKEDFSKKYEDTEKELDKIFGTSSDKRIPF